jgi:hypothetical protein
MPACVSNNASQVASGKPSMARRTSEYALASSFQIDLLSLWSIEPVEAFIFGVEWGMAWEKARAPRASLIWVHTANSDRVETLLRSQGRTFTVTPASAGFVEIAIDGLA